MISLTINQISLVLNLIGAFILGGGLIKTNRRIRLESGTYHSRNRFLAQSMRQERTLTVIGLVVISAGFVLPLIFTDNRYISLDLLNGWPQKILDLIVVFLGVFLGFWLSEKSKIKNEKEYYFQILLALQTEIQRNEGHLTALKNTKQANLIHLLSLEVGKYYLNNSLTYKFSGAHVAEIWAYLESIRKVKSVSQDDCQSLALLN